MDSKVKGTIVKCHHTRSLQENRTLARSLLTTKLDNLINKEQSIEAQKKRIDEKKLGAKRKKREKLDRMKLEWKNRENIE